MEQNLKPDLIKEQNIKLDLILDIYCTRVNDESYTFYPFPFMVEKNIQNEELKFSDNEWSILKERLIKDEYFEMKTKHGEKTPLFLLNQKGINFWNNGRGGYVKQYKKEKNKECYEKIYRWGLFAIAAIGVFISIYQIDINSNLQKEQEAQKYRIDTLQVKVYQLTHPVPKHQQNKK
ncbi:MAG: hypothetical protein WAS34_18780 [Thiolinea sp.]